MYPRKQYGYLFEKGPSWFGCWHQNVLEGNVVIRKKMVRRLGATRDEAESRLKAIVAAVEGSEMDWANAARAYRTRLTLTTLKLERGIVEKLQKGLQKLATDIVNAQLE